MKRLTDSAPDTPDDVDEVSQEEPRVGEGGVILGRVVQAAVPQHPGCWHADEEVDYCTAQPLSGHSPGHRAEALPLQ